MDQCRDSDTIQPVSMPPCGQRSAMSPFPLAYRIAKLTFAFVGSDMTCQLMGNLGVAKRL
jgi:hypothetical protein